MRPFVKPVVQAAALAAAVAAGTQYTVVDREGHVVGTLVTDGAVAAQIRVAGLAAARRAKPPEPDGPPDRSFHPDYSRALSTDQMTRAWHDEIDRLSPPFITGGG